MKNERIAFKLRNPEGYAQIWEKKSKSQGKISPIWLIPTALLAFGTGLSFWLISKSRQEKQHI